MMRQYELVDRVRRYNPHDRRGAAQPRLRVCDEGPRGSGPRLRRSHTSRTRSKSPPFSLNTCIWTMPPSSLRFCTIRDRGHGFHAGGNRRASLGKEIGASRRWPDQAEASSTSCRSARCRRKTSASCFWRSRPTCACCWSSSPTGCTTCARCTSWRSEKRARIAEETLDIYAPLAGRMGMQRLRDELEDHGVSPSPCPRRYATIEARLERHRAQATTCASWSPPSRRS